MVAQVIFDVPLLGEWIEEVCPPLHAAKQPTAQNMIRKFAEGVYKQFTENAGKKNARCTTLLLLLLSVR